ncbi:CDP-glycerol glycerophosphotransferase family protein [Mammaliicoccus sciuri]|uniref:CDP-glycerol glycerophosphotransferase family protein n=1 Tax=Mammaliicoccus sciuri TaxID=1296 RepID=UPI0021CE7A70|nr:CDP-glycerol glycerophosphotransferase family protein [Mammaliicoccus sciuri]UXU83074.1 CDP-glycerol glycerophosphotransferase family protein [Mammaliicoccus sciuri]UXU92920.1 CDP-glycerol glycerophosphotransferase family protein [Mammaliicoccus sciuri]UXV14822.1 CDP-glycerol glycerophosphotransferase family protein [Mammaliicoccus sciuri]UXV23133.1 CDP-glycerol glycerophosphotransferase family protein [Mammaliicoccus sciuri]UXV25865.1 CDP-glycerol glycerophosphotransferase family protein [
MEEKLFLMTEKSFKSTVAYFNNKEDINSTDKEKLLYYLNKVFNPLFPYKFDFILKNRTGLSILLRKINYNTSKKSVFKYLEGKAMKRGDYKYSYMLSQFRKSLSILRSKNYVLDFKPNKVDETIVYESFNGRSFTDSPKMLYFYLKDALPNYKHIVVTDNHGLDENLRLLNIETVKKNTKQYFKVYKKAKVWIANTRLSPQLEKKENQLFIQTWHGTPLKKLANDQTVISIPEITLEEYLYGFNKETSRWDFLISPSETATKRFKSAFNLKEEQILTLGYPRNDDLVQLNNEDYIHQLKQKYEIPSHKKVILYAPTWRDNDRTDIGNYNFKLKIDLDSFSKELSDEYVLLIRAHYLVSEHLNLENYTNVYDLSYANDINELFLMSDVLITDYSSVYFDYANLRRPILFFAYDKDEYANDIRGFYLPYESELPGPVFETSEALIKYIKSMQYVDIPHSDNYRKFNNKYNQLDDGGATERVSEKIIGTLDKEKEFQ